MMIKDIMKDLYTFVLCSIVLAVTLLVCYHLCLDTSGDGDPSLRGQAFGGLMGLAGSAMGYWIATTKSNTDKDKTIAEVLKHSSGTTAATVAVSTPPVKDDPNEKENKT